MIRLSIQARQALAKLTLPVLFVLSFGFVLLGKVDAMLAERARISLADLLTPVYGVLAVPAANIHAGIDRISDLWNTGAELQRLRDENERLRQWQSVALALESENQRLKASLNWVPTPASPFITARVVGDAGGVYARAALIALDGNHFVRKGMVALDDRGVVGRITDAGSRSARVLLISDINSRIPVLLERSHSHAIMAGTNGPRPHLMYWTEGAPQQGERVVTSGEGGALPPGLPIGTVTYTAQHVPEVTPDAQLDRLEFLRVFDFDVSGQPQGLGMASDNAHGG